MLIRSQDKKCLASDLNLYIHCEKRCINGEDVVPVKYSIYNSKLLNLGDYSTEEKAIRVLDIIQSAYMKTTKFCISNEGEVSQVPVPCVWNMPCDEEV